MDKTFNVGKIVNTHGVRGEIKIYPYTDDLSKFEILKYLLIEGEGEVKFKITAVREHKGMILMKLKGYNDINEVQRFMDKNVYIYRADIESIDDGEGHYIVDLIGCEIVDASGTVVGTLKDVLQNTSQDLYEVQTPEGKLFYIPVVDAFVKAIDIEAKRITVQMIEGLIE